MLTKLQNKILMRNNFVQIFLSDFIVRYCYQIGKTPLLPLFAASIGVAELLIGIVVSVSTMTGMLLKPIFGILSDRWGRKLWLIIAVILFSITPFLYQFVNNARELMILRLFHGISTAIFGPVSLAYVVGISSEELGKRIGFFGMARLMASLLAPLTAGTLLTFFYFEAVFFFIGVCSLLAMFPIFLLSENNSSSVAKRSIFQQFRTSLNYSVKMATIWLAGFFELLIYLIIYAVKAFLPIFIISQESGSVFKAGLFFFIQEGFHLLSRPIGGKLSDKNGQIVIIIAGMVLISLGLILLTYLPGYLLLVAALLFGVGQGLIFPSSVALLSRNTNKEFLGAAMGFYGALRNLGKVIGPILAGLMLTKFSYYIVFNIFAIFLIGIIGCFLYFYFKKNTMEEA